MNHAPTFGFCVAAVLRVQLPRRFGRRNGWNSWNGFNPITLPRPTC